MGSWMGAEMRYLLLGDVCFDSKEDVSSEDVVERKKRAGNRAEIISSTSVKHQV